MPDRNAIERDIRQLLATETRTTVLSNSLFQQGTGLFRQLWSSQQEKKEVMESDLFREAMDRVRDLQYRDAKALAAAAHVLHEQLPENEFGLTLESPIRAAS